MEGSSKKNSIENSTIKDPFTQLGNKKDTNVQAEPELPEVDDKLIGDDLEIQQAQVVEERSNTRPKTDKNNY